MRTQTTSEGGLARRAKQMALLALLAAVLAAIAALGLAAPASAATFSNNDGITINDGHDKCAFDEMATAPGSATPYPSEIAVSGLGSSVSDVNVTISGLSHDFPDDIGLLLVSPAGQSTILMTDSGGDNTASGIALTFDDAASVPLPDDTQLSSGTYLPSRGTSNMEGCGAPASFPGQAPAGPYGPPSLSVFNGSNPNGTWKLYAIDDTGILIGSITGWSLDITTPNTPPTVAVAAGGSCGTDDRSGTINLLVGDRETKPGDLAVTASSDDNQSLVPDGNLVLTYDPTRHDRNYTLTATAVSGRTGTAKLTVKVTDGDGATGTVTVTLQAGGTANDTLTGTSGADILLGQKGNDTLNGLAGNDLLCGGRDNDKLTGGAGADHFSGGLSIDVATDFNRTERDTQDGTIDRQRDRRK